MREPKSNEAEFTSYWVRAQPLVTSYVFSSIRQTQDAEDVLQEVASAALTDFAKYDPARPFLAWVLGIAKFRVLNHYRKSSGDRLVLNDAALTALADAHETLDNSASDRRHALAHCLQQVDNRKRQVLDLRYAKETSVASIAEQLDSTPNAVSLMLHKVRKSLADCIRRRLRIGEKR